ncbi:MAG: hypothetical protein BWY73_01335 [candidate division TA06 bacterium ADurb.Bin417]|uniref:DUF1553 domain-containing protein n=1 Tax=candidate division TA06 bacterium ADurb.Bin417 TaxID=1852828 RepID=A0A1V5MC33_UNCT6|nr:MAG: hypothetical protein BWY73_01335 [candidate division TA06 bacterium ADurb.Bin417]
MLAGLGKRGIKPAPLCSDEIFVRRVYLDVIGTLPEPAEVTAFLEDPRPDKRSALIDTLLARPEFADYWSLKWCDILRVKAEFPINLWPNAVQAYHRWIRDSLRENLPYDRFARALLTSSGSNFRVPPVNFYRAVQGRDAPSIARVVALTFMGTRLESWPAERRAGLEACFSRIAYKKTAEWKEEIVQLDPAPAAVIETVMADGTRLKIPPEQDPRRVFADWLLAPGNPWFTRSIVNRAWSWFMSYGIIHEPDDLRPDNPPVNPELLAGLEKYLVDNKYDLKLLFKAILNSNTYQQSSIPDGNNPESARFFACYPVRQLEAEVLIDALNWIAGGGGEEYSSPIPEPFTFTPRRQRSILLSDGSITSPFLEMFGRPGRDTGLESERSRQPSAAQRMCLMNSSEIQRKITMSSRLQKMLASVKWNRELIIEQTYLIILSRRPTREEAEIAAAYFQANTSLGYKAANDDLAWTLINSKEFLCRH